jgi:hypothetical protein
VTSSRSRREVEGVSAGLVWRDAGEERELLARSPIGDDGELRPRLRLLFGSLVGLILAHNREREREREREG